jgi:hypothetical protein
VSFGYESIGSLGDVRDGALGEESSFGVADVLVRRLAFRRRDERRQKEDFESGGQRRDGRISPSTDVSASLAGASDRRVLMR